MVQVCISEQSVLGESIIHWKVIIYVTLPCTRSIKLRSTSTSCYIFHSIGWFISCGSVTVPPLHSTLLLCPGPGPGSPGQRGTCWHGHGPAFFTSMMLCCFDFFFWKKLIWYSKNAYQFVGQYFVCPKLDSFWSQTKISVVNALMQLNAYQQSDTPIKQSSHMMWVNTLEAWVISVAKLLFSNV